MNTKQTKTETRIKKLFFTLSNRNVTIQQGTNWAINLKSNHVTYPPSSLDLTDTEILGYLLHELGHGIFTKTPTGKNRVTDSADQELLNMIEDLREEHWLKKTYPNAAAILDPKWSTDGQALARMADKIPPYQQFILNIANQFLGLPLMGESSVQQTIDGLQFQIPYVVEASRSTSDIVRKWGKIKSEFDLLKPKASDKPKPEGKGGDTSKAKGKKPIPRLGKCSFSDALQKPKPTPKQKKPGKKPGKKPSKGFSLAPFLDKTEEQTFDYNQLKSEATPLINEFNNRITHVLQDNQYNKAITGFTSGSTLTTNKLYKFKTNNYRFFEKRYSKVKSYEFAVMVDESGSMGNQMHEVKRAVVMVCEGLNKARVPYSITRFSDDVQLIKPLAADLSTMQKQRVADIHAHGGTNDSGAVRTALASLHNPRSKQIMLVITDGIGQSNEVRDLLAANRSVATLGIGLNVDVSTVYPNAINTSIDNLPTELINSLKKLI